jgi:hypothetical protein
MHSGWKRSQNGLGRLICDSCELGSTPSARAMDDKLSSLIQDGPNPLTVALAKMASEHETVVGGLLFRLHKLESNRFKERAAMSAILLISHIVHHFLL